MTIDNQPPTTGSYQIASSNPQQCCGGAYIRLYIPARFSIINIGGVVGRTASWIAFALAAAAGLAAAGCKEKTANESPAVEKAAVDSSAPVTPAPAPPAAPPSVASAASPAAVVDSLYRIHNNGLGPILDLKGEKVRRQYFDSSLAAQFQRNLVGPPNGEVGNLDFDPFYNAQETEIHDFTIGEPSLKGDSATVPVSFRNFDRKQKLTYMLVNTADGWRIRDIDYGEPGDEETLAEMLSKPW